MPLVLPRPEKLQAIARRFPVIDALSLETCIWLFRSASALAESNDATYAKHGLSRGRFYVLIHLHQSEADGLSPHQLAESTGVTRAAMTGQIDALVEAGLVVRVLDPSDRRSYRVRLHPKGFALLEQFLPHHFARMKALVAGLSAEEKLLLQALLSKVVSRLDAFASGATSAPASPSSTARRAPLAKPAARAQTQVRAAESRKPQARLKASLSRSARSQRTTQSFS